MREIFIYMNPLDNLTKQKLPNATLVLILGILSIPTCCLYFGLPGLALGVTSLIFYGKDINLYRSNPEMYTEASLSNLKGGRVCAIIGIVLSSLAILSVIIGIAMFGWAAMNDPEELKRILERYQ